MPITVKNISYTFSPKTPYEKKALDDISLTIEDGEFFGIIGHTGSGKSTLVSHFNALTRVQTGEIVIDEFVLGKKKIKKRELRNLRARVGHVFQFPEYQLFADSVLADVSFGPKNLRLPKDEIYNRAKEAIELVGLDFEAIKDRSPFELSGGQKRRVAIAGVLAMKPKILILDEPTSGLDPQGKIEILELVQKIRRDACKIVIMISHNMDEVASVADRIAVLNKGKLATILPPKELFRSRNLLQKFNISMPEASSLANELADKGYKIDRGVVTVEELVEEIKRLMRNEE
ncbi:MAG: energy-coupling factor transporter ATPase [Firmicutes bacterium]|nr:energy-coupling factor transporter ATPase [Bacillota bacterium]